MTAPNPVLDGLVDLAALVVQPAPDLTAALREHHRIRSGRQSWLLGDLVVADRQLAEVGRTAVGPDPLPVCVLNTTGAGGLVALGSRSPAGIEVRAVQSALRDLDDLAGNAARTISAATALPEHVAVYVEIPASPGWERAVERVEAAGLLAALRMSGSVPSTTVAAQLSAFIEADLPFRANGTVPSVLGLLSAVHALVEGATPDEAAALLHPADALGSHTSVVDADATVSARLRRRVRRVESSDWPRLTDELSAAGVLEPA